MPLNRGDGLGIASLIVVTATVMVISYNLWSPVPYANFIAIGAGIVGIILALIGYLITHSKLALIGLVVSSTLVVASIINMIFPFGLFG
jgi:tetrahydromethanopterin S-methyltransferase subunit C